VGDAEAGFEVASAGVVAHSELRRTVVVDIAAMEIAVVALVPCV